MTAVPEQIAHYSILEKLGAGGMGDVYLARDSKLGRNVALKVLPSAIAADTERLARFVQEARSASALSHPNVAHVYEIGEAGGQHYIALEYVEGRSLHAHMAGRRFGVAEIIEIGIQLADALEEAHARGIIHRDIKPANIMLTPRGTVKILDFGLAKFQPPVGTPGAPDAPTAILSPANTQPGTMMGTVGYMCPEQVLGEATDARSDLFSLGVVLYEMAAGRLPFRGATLGGSINALLNEEPAPIAERNSEIPAGLARMIGRALAKKPEMRTQSAAEMAADLRRLRRVSDLDETAASGPRRSLASVGDFAVPFRYDAAPEPSPLDGSASPGTSSSLPASNLPARTTPIVGRERDTAAVRDLLLDPDVRLLTLTGPGGMGKTRLSVQVAAAVAGHFPDGVHFVALAAIFDPALLLPAIAQVLGALEAPARSLAATLIERLRGRRLLLVLDNFEQIVAAAPQLIELLEGVAGLVLLATSRFALRLRGEHEYPVPPLALPALEEDVPGAEPASADPRALGAFPAVELFLQRAVAVNPAFRLTPQNAGVVARICARLDGLPLAIELAAARIKLLPPQRMLERLADPLRLLAGGARDLPDRHQSLRQAIDWSYELLDEGERLLFRRLAVFVGGATLPGAEAVCAGAIGKAAALLADEVFAAIGSLADKSLLAASEGLAGESRFKMLETLRDYALERLEESGEAEEVRRRHGLFFLDFAERLERERRESDQAGWLTALEEEHGNLRAVLAGSAQRDPATGLRLAAAIWRFWYLHGHYREGRGWLEALLAASSGSATPERARALTAGGVLAFLQCDYRRATELLEAGLALSRQLGERENQAESLQRLGSVARERGDHQGAVALHRDSLALWRELANQAGIARSLNYVSFAAWLQGDLTLAESLAEQTLEMFNRLDDREGIAWSFLNLGAVALYRGDTERAGELCGESLAQARDVGYKEGIAWSLDLLGNTAALRGDPEEAARLLRESLHLHWELGDRWRVSSLFEGLAEAAAAGGSAADNSVGNRAARLIGAARTLRAAIGTPLPPAEQPALERAVAAVSQALGPAAFEDAVAEGAALPLERAVTEALRRR